MSRRMWFTSIGLAGFFSFACLTSAYADKELVSMVTEKVKKAGEKVEAVEQKLQPIKKMADVAIQTGERLKNLETGLVNNLVSFSEIDDLATQAVIQTGTDMLSGMISSSTSTEDDDTMIDKVVETYTRSNNESTEDRQKLFAHLRYNNGRSLARLYARALMLRCSLQEEETPQLPDTADNIQAVLAQINTLMITSGKRWNTILETEAYINEYIGTIEMQNVTRDDSDD